MMRNKKNIGGKLSPARRGALKILSEVLDRERFASRQIDVYLKTHRLTPEDRGLLTQLVYGVLRRKGVLDRILFSFLRKDSPKFLLHALRMGLYQLLFLEKIPDHAVLFETVEGIKIRGGDKLSGVGNKILREVQRDKERWRQQVMGEEWVRFHYPDWLWRRWEKNFGPEKALHLGKYFNETPVLWGRRHGVKVADLPFIAIAPGEYGRALEQIKQGQLSLQDPHSYQVVRELNPQRGEKGLDACAGHGGKTAVIAELREGEVKDALFVFDSSSARLKELKENFNRLKLSLPNIINKKYNLSLGSLDWILIDAPCSGLGTLGRKPEIRWRIEPQDLPRHQEKQGALLQEWVPYVKPGGRLLYSVCSLEPEEGSEVLEKFLRGHPHWEEKGKGLLWPGENGEDGFFWGRLVRKI